MRISSNIEELFLFHEIIKGKDVNKRPVMCKLKCYKNIQVINNRFAEILIYLLDQNSKLQNNIQTKETLMGTISLMKMNSSVILKKTTSQNFVTMSRMN